MNYPRTKYKRRKMRKMSRKEGWKEEEEIGYLMSPRLEVQVKEVG